MINRILVLQKQIHEFVTRARFEVVRFYCFLHSVLMDLINAPVETISLVQLQSWLSYTVKLIVIRL